MSKRVHDPIEIDPEDVTEPRWKTVFSRWWVLFLFCSLAILQAASWNFYGPISESIIEVYGWDDAQISWLANAANISLFIALPFMSMAIDYFGLRPTTLLAAFFLVICVGLRCIPTITALGLAPTSKTTLILSYVSMCFNGLSGTLMNFLAPVISFFWFPMEQRAVSTGLMSAAAPIGVALGFLIGPSIVPVKAVDKAAVTGIVTAAILLYYPSKPLVPPTPSAAAKEDEKIVLGGGYKKIFGSCSRRSARLLLIALIFGLMNGINGGWGAVLNQNLGKYGISQDDASWIGFGIVVIGCCGGIVFGFLADRFAGKLKSLILISLSFSWASYLWFTLTILGYIPGNKTVIYASLLLGGLFISTPIPLFFELAMETAYPEIEEGSAASLLSLSSTLLQILFLANAFTPNTDISWMNWLVCCSYLLVDHLSLVFVVSSEVTASSPVCMLLLILYRAEYTRLGSDLASKGKHVKISRVDAGGWL